MKNVHCQLLLQNGTTVAVKNDQVLRKQMSQAERDTAIMRMGNKLLRAWLSPVFCSEGVVLVDDRCCELHTTGSLHGRAVNKNNRLWQLIGQYKIDKVVYGDALFVPKELVQVEIYDRFMASTQTNFCNTLRHGALHKRQRKAC